MKQFIFFVGFILGLTWILCFLWDTFIDTNIGVKEMTFELSKVTEYDELFREPKPDLLKESFDKFEEAVDEYEKTLVGEGEHHWLTSIRIRVERKMRYTAFPGFRDRYYVEVDISFRTKEQYEQLDDIIEKVIELADEHLHKEYQAIEFDTWEYTDQTPFLRGNRYIYKRK